MTTTVRLTGFEHGLGAISSNGGGLVDGVTGNVTVTPAPIHPTSGSYVLHCAPTAGAYGYITWNLATPTTVVTRFYIYFEALPAANIIIFSMTTTGHKVQITWKQADAKLYVGIDGALTTVAASTIAAGTWYCIDVKSVISANPWLTDWRIDYVAQTQNSYAHAAETFSAMDLGVGSKVIALIDYDDWIYSVTAADFPIGPGGTIGLRPDSDGAHNNAAGVLQDNGGHDIDGATYFAYSLLDEPFWSGGAANDYVKQNAVGAANYVEVNFADDVTRNSANYISVSGVLQYMASGSGADTGGCVIRDNTGTETELWGKSGGLKDYSETTPYYKSAIIAVPAGGWTTSEVNALKCRMGYSDNVATKPYWLALLLEVAYSLPVSSVLVTNAAVMVEDRQDVDSVRVTNAVVEIEDRQNIDTLRVTNVAIMIEWLPGGTLKYDAEVI